MDSERPMTFHVFQDVVDDAPVGEPGDVVEVFERILGVTPGVGTAQHGHGPTLTAHVANGVGELSRLGERRDEDEVGFLGYLLQQVLKAGIAHELHVMPGFLTPYRDDLRHDAREVGVHDPGVQGLGGSLGYQVDDGDLKLLHGASDARNL